MPPFVVDENWEFTRAGWINRLHAANSGSAVAQLMLELEAVMMDTILVTPWRESPGLIDDLHQQDQGRVIINHACRRRRKQFATSSAYPAKSKTPVASPIRSQLDASNILQGGRRRRRTSYNESSYSKSSRSKDAQAKENNMQVEDDEEYVPDDLKRRRAFAR